MEMLKPVQASKELDIPGTTLRRYVRDYAQHLSPDASKPGRAKRLTADDLAILARARRLLRDGNTPASVNKMLFLNEDSEPDDKQLAILENIPLAILELEFRTRSDIELLLARVEDLENRTFWDMLLKRRKRG